MADKIEVCLSEFSDIEELAPNLRKGDLKELEALNVRPFQALLRGYIFSDECFTARLKSKIVGMFGYSGFGLKQDIAVIWFLGTDELTRHPIEFVKGGRKYVEYFTNKYSTLTNIVYKENTVHINWLKRIGMTMSNSVYINGHEFIKFYIKHGKEKKCVI